MDIILLIVLIITFSILTGGIQFTKKEKKTDYPDCQDCGHKFTGRHADKPLYIADGSIICADCRADRCFY